MAQPVSFPSATATFGLPMLFAGQAQKEFTLNQSLVMIDALLSGVVALSAAAPPADPDEGTIGRVLANPQGAWAGQEDHLALYIGGDWHFFLPRSGSRIFDRSANCMLVYDGNWTRADAPPSPQGGSVIDVEARAAIAQLTTELARLGLLHDPD